MRNVYKHSTVTIAATNSSNANAGILSQEILPKDLYSLSLHYESAHNMRGNLHFRRSTIRQGRLASFPLGPLSARGWTVQEKVLSTRTIHFGHEEIVWDCSTFYETDAEENPIFFGNTLPSVSLPLQSELPQTEYIWESGRNLVNYDAPLEKWYDIINEYGTRNLTVPEDRLPAISGVAREISLLAQGTYCAGLWKEDLHRGLLWSFNGAGFAHMSKYLAPSWSWASVAFERSQFKRGRFSSSRDRAGYWKCEPYRIAHLASLQKRHHEYDVEVLDCVIVPARDDEYGLVSSGSLTLRGLCIQALKYRKPAVENDSKDLLMFKRGCTSRLFRRSFPRTYISCIMDNYDDSSHRGGPLAALPQSSPEDEGAILIHQGSSEDLSERDWTSEESDSEPAVNILPYPGSKHKDPRITYTTRLKPGSIFLQICKWSSDSNPQGIIFALLLEPAEKEGEFRVVVLR
jgi:hypothetical protein